MAENPDDRYQDIAAWNAAVHNALTGPFSPEAIVSGRLDDAPPTWARPALAAVAGICMGIIVAGLFWYDGKADGTTDTTVISVPDTSAGPTTPSVTAGPPGKVNSPTTS